LVVAHKKDIRRAAGQWWDLTAAPYRLFLFEGMMMLMLLNNLKIVWKRARQSSK